MKTLSPDRSPTLYRRNSLMSRHTMMKENDYDNKQQHMNFNTAQHWTLRGTAMLTMLDV
jgi:hypothetical protein